MKEEIREALKRLPAVDEALREVEGGDGDASPRWSLVQAIRDEIAELRDRILEGRLERTDIDAAQVKRRARELIRPSLKPLYNATGVVVHTNLGRAPLGAEILQRIVQVAEGYSNLEYRLDQRRRGSRHDHVARIICQLTGAEEAAVVNNNAAAVFICLAALARQREVVVSRGELIEIGGSFRLPDVMAASGALLREVGTTNRTHPRDYESAICEETALLLKAHRSNFAVVGFTNEVEPGELVEIGRRREIPTMFDLGSGCLIDLAELGLPGEMTVQEAVGAGFDLVTFSGDKLLGGPQAGIIVGRRETVTRIRAHPLMRPLRPDKMTLAGLTATLEVYRDGEAQSAIPVLAMLSTPEAEIKRRAGRLRTLLREGLPAPWSAERVQVRSMVGGGALPEALPPSWAVAIHHPELGPDRVEGRLRGGDPPVVARIEDQRLLLDLRTIGPEQLIGLARAVTGALA
jgi:L-seryl-tRNA(Ser) seleniumtransferase